MAPELNYEHSMATQEEVEFETAGFGRLRSNGQPIFHGWSSNADSSLSSLIEVASHGGLGLTRKPLVKSPFSRSQAWECRTKLIA